MSESEAVDNGKTSPSASEAAETDSKTSSNTESGQASSSSSAKQDASKVDILLKPAGDAPIMKKKKWQVGRTKKISWVSTFIRNYIKSEQSESLFLYVNQSFAPSPDTDIGSLFDCFGSDGKLVLHYCRTQAWG